MRKPPRPADPERRAVILDATLDVIAEHGTAGTTMRRVADHADVPLGSMTYYFDGKQQLLVEAFTLLAERFSTRFRDQLEAATSQDEALQAIASVVSSPLGDPKTLLLNYELYAFASHDEAVRHVMTAWMASSRESLQLHFDPLTARGIDALLEGLLIHNSFDAHPATHADLIRLLTRLIPTP